MYTRRPANRNIVLCEKSYTYQRETTSLGPVVNILAIFSNANILKNKRIKIYHIKGIGCPLLISINIDALGHP